MSIPVNLREIQSGYLTAIAFNENNATLAEAFEKALNREGGDNNAMEADLDMGMNQISNLKAATSNFQAVNLKQVRDLISASSEEIVSLIKMEDRITATDGQTEIELEAVVYTPGTNSLMVFKNGEYQRADEEYLETANNKIEFVTPLSDGDIVDIFGARYDAQQYVELAILASNLAEQYRDEAAQYAADAAASADLAVAAAGYKLDVNNQTGVSYTLTIDDAGDFVRMDNSAENEVIVPSHASVPFEQGTIILIRQIGDGTTKITPALGVTVNAPFDNYEISSSDFGVALVKVDDNEWDMIKAFGGVAGEDLQLLAGEFDARLEELFNEILSADPTFVVNFDSLRNFVNTEVDNLQASFDTLNSNTADAVNQINTGFADISTQFDAITNQFNSISVTFTNILSQFSDIQTEFSNIQSQFTDIQNEWANVDARMDDIQEGLDAINFGTGFSNLLEETGYQDFPGGLTLQWVTKYIGSGTGSATFTFAKPFPNAVLSVNVTDCPNTQNSDSRKPLGGYVSSITRENVKVSFLSRGLGVNQKISVWAVGY